MSTVVKVFAVIGVAAVIAVLFAVIVYLSEKVINRFSPYPDIERTPEREPEKKEEPVTEEEAMPQPGPTDPLLVPAPAVQMGDGWVSLYDWARSKREDAEARTVFQEIVADFYTDCLTDHRVAFYFPGQAGIGELRAHFTTTFMMLAQNGLTQSTAEYLADAHRHLGITSESYDIVIGHLVRTLTAVKYDVPNTPECLGRLATMIEMAKPLIVTKGEQ